MVYNILIRMVRHTAITKLKLLEATTSRWYQMPVRGKAGTEDQPVGLRDMTEQRIKVKMCHRIRHDVVTYLGSSRRSVARVPWPELPSFSHSLRCSSENAVDEFGVCATHF